jgi:monoamine oxidase
LLRFCGEHLATGSRGMEGAMESAERAAAEILERV